MPDVDSVALLSFDESAALPLEAKAPIVAGVIALPPTLPLSLYKKCPFVNPVVVVVVDTALGPAGP